MPPERAAAVIAAVEDALRQGFPPRGITPVAGSHGAVSEGLRRLGYATSTGSYVLRRAVEITGREPDWSLYNAKPGTPRARLSVDEALQVRADAADRAADKLRIAELESRLLHAEAWQRKAATVLNAPANPGAWPKAAKPGKGAGELVPLLLCSDFQTGEVIQAREIEGLNAYSTQIFRERYAAMIDKTILLMTRHTGAKQFPGCVVVNLGDLISNEIHEDLATTNDLASVPSLLAVYEAEREGLTRLREAFGRVRCYRVAGNHDRPTAKPRSKGASEHSYAMLVSYMLARAFDKDPRVEIIAPPSVDVAFGIYGYRFLGTHGDRMGSSGGQGFVGPAATIARGHQRLIHNYAQTGQVIDYVLTGHLHTSLKLEHGYANGSVAGYSQYARDGRYKPAAAAQWLLGVHRDQGVAHAFELHLSPRPRRPHTLEALAA
jgi:hypothetical protein